MASVNLVEYFLQFNLDYFPLQFCLFFFFFFFVRLTLQNLILGTMCNKTNLSSRKYYASVIQGLNDKFQDKLNFM